MKFTRSLRHLLVIGAAVTFLGLAVHRAHARSVAAITGAAGGADQACLGIFFGNMTNNCGHVVSFDWPLVVDNGGAKSVIVTALGAAPANNVGCRAMGLNKETTTAFFSNGGAFVFLPSFGAPADINVGPGASVPSSGQLLVNCQMNPGSRIQVANWNP